MVFDVYLYQGQTLPDGTTSDDQTMFVSTDAGDTWVRSKLVHDTLTEDKHGDVTTLQNPMFSSRRTQAQYDLCFP